MLTKPTISQITDVPGVSIATALRLVNNIATVKGSTAKEIMEAIHSLDYPLPENLIATNTKKDGEIILISIPFVSNPFYNNVIEGVQDATLHHDYYTLVSIQHLNSSIESTFLNLLNNINLCDATILNAMDQGYFNSPYHTIPFIQCCEYVENQNLASYTNIDDAAAAKTMVEYILSTGYAEIVFLYESDRYKYARQRKVGHLQTLEAAHILLNKDRTTQLPELDFDMVLSSAHQFMSQREHSTAVPAVSDVLVVAATRGCRLTKLSAPADTIATGFDSVNISQATSPLITTISQPKHQTDYMAREFLTEKLNTFGAKPRQMLLNTEFIVWESTQRQCTQHQNITDREAYFGAK